MEYHVRELVILAVVQVMGLRHQFSSLIFFPPINHVSCYIIFTYRRIRYITSIKRITSSINNGLKLLILVVNIHIDIQVSYHKSPVNQGSQDNSSPWLI